MGIQFALSITLDFLSAWPTEPGGLTTVEQLSALAQGPAVSAGVWMEREQSTGPWSLSPGVGPPVICQCQPSPRGTNTDRCQGPGVGAPHSEQRTSGQSRGLL